MKTIKFYHLSYLLLLVFSACEMLGQFKVGEEIKQVVLLQEDPFQSADLPDYFVNQLKKFKEAEVNKYKVVFTDREVKNSGGKTTTTFRYKVTGTGHSPELEKFFLEVPECAGKLVEWIPAKNSKLTSKGIEWSEKIGKDETVYFAMTFEGEVPFGVIETAVTRGGKKETCQIVGPCKGVAEICGSMFIDANEDGVKQAAETGIPDIMISIFEKKSKELVGQVKTQANGVFTILLLDGEYIIKTEEDLWSKNYNPSTPSSVEICTTDEHSCIEFGYAMDNAKLVDDLRTGNIEGNAECTDYWIKQLELCDTDKGDYTSKEILEFLKNIEKLYVPEPFQFGSNKINAALKILKSKSDAEIDKFLKELLTAELNIVSSRGALKVVDGETVIDDNFNSALIIYAEAIGCEELGTCEPLSERLDPFSPIKNRTMNTRLVEATDALSAFNGTGGIRN